MIMLNSNGASIIADALGETGDKQVKQIERACQTFGEAFMQSLLKDVKTAYASGEMLSADGKPRSVGGVFFALLRKRVSDDEWFFIQHGRSRASPSTAHRQPDAAMEWSERLDAAREAHPGAASWVRVSVVGQVDMSAVESLESYMLVTVYSGDHIPPLPKGLPTPTSMVSTFRVGIPLTQWREVERDVRAGEPLIVSGYPMANEKKGTVTVYALKTETPSIKQRKVKKWKARAR
jgi:hypothetical protein